MSRIWQKNNTAHVATLNTRTNSNW